MLLGLSLQNLRCGLPPFHPNLSIQLGREEYLDLACPHHSQYLL
jgi:hypothetical protein